MFRRRPGEMLAPGGSQGGWCQAAKRKQEGSARALRANRSWGEPGATETLESSTTTAEFPQVKRYQRSLPGEWNASSSGFPPFAFTSWLPSDGNQADSRMTAAYGPKMTRSSSPGAPSGYALSPTVSTKSGCQDSIIEATAVSFLVPLPKSPTTAQVNLAARAGAALKLPPATPAAPA